MKPNLLNKTLFILSFNLFMFGILHFIARINITWKLILAINFIALVIVSVWLPKQIKDMDEREKLHYIKMNHFMYNFSTIWMGVIFSIHLIWFPQMTVIEFMVLTGIPTTLALSIKSILLKREI